MHKRSRYGDVLMYPSKSLLVMLSICYHVEIFHLVLHQFTMLKWFLYTKGLTENHWDVRKRLIFLFDNYISRHVHASSVPVKRFGLKHSNALVILKHISWGISHLAWPSSQRTLQDSEPTTFFGTLRMQLNTAGSAMVLKHCIVAKLIYFLSCWIPPKRALDSA